jgi:DNA-binding CsgD family transcriptional regulator
MPNISRGRKLKNKIKFRETGIIMAMVFLLQVSLSGAFLFDLLSSKFALSSTPLPWQVREYIELAAASGLLIGIFVTFYELVKTRRNVRNLYSRIRVASSAFYDLVEDEFDGWGLSPKERDVAIFILKGLSNLEISRITDKKEGTVKAQTNSLFRKAGVSSRSQFACYFIEVLLQEPLVEAVEEPLAKGGRV